MTIFEYLSVAVSIVLSLAVVRLINGVAYAFASERRSCVHIGWVIFLGIQIVLVWWNNWAYRSVEDWILPGFVLVLLMPVALFFMASTLVPDNPSSVESWNDHFLQVRRRFFLAYVFLLVLFSLSSWLLLELPALHPQRLVHALASAGCILGAFSESPRVQKGLVTFAFAVLLAAIGSFYLRPGGIAPA